MFQVSVTTTTLPVAVVCSRGLLITMVVMLAPFSVDQTTLGQHDLLLLAQLILRHTIRVLLAPTMQQQQQPQSQIPSQTYASYDMDLLQVCFPFKSLTDHHFLMSYIGVCYGFCFLFSVRLPCDCHDHQLGLHFMDL